MQEHSLMSRSSLHTKMRHGSIQFAGNSRLKIYGSLTCGSGKKMKIENRVFFASETEAIHYGYRPCGHCMREAYQRWKSLQSGK